MVFPCELERFFSVSGFVEQDVQRAKELFYHGALYLFIVNDQNAFSAKIGTCILDNGVIVTMEFLFVNDGKCEREFCISAFFRFAGDISAKSVHDAFAVR